MSTPRVAVTPSRRDGSGELYMNERIGHALTAHGVEPVLILPSDLSEPTLPERLSALSGLLLPGGPDVHPRCYGASVEPACGAVWEERDELELALMNWAMREGRPILGVCRGVQMINVALGGTLYQDLPSNRGLYHRQSDEVTYLHDVVFEPDSLPGRLIASDRYPVNSYHHQALRRVADGLKVTAFSADGVIEAVESTTRQFILGVQWHPESTFERDVLSRRIFAEFARQLTAST